MATNVKKEGKTEETIKQNNTAFAWIEQIISMCNKYGVLKMIFAVIFMVFISYAAYIAFNPTIMFDKYSAYIEKQHSESLEYRLESSPLIQSMLDELVDETGAMRAYVIEMHNGKNNPSGLSFIYGSLNYEAVNDSACSIMEDYDDFSLERFALLSKVYKEGYWSGTTDEMREFDKRFALRTESNDASYLAMTMIYGIREDIGFLGLSFEDGSNVDSERIKSILTKYSSRLSPLLDGYKSRIK